MRVYPTQVRKSEIPPTWEVAEKRQGRIMEVKRDRRRKTARTSQAPSWPAWHAPRAATCRRLFPRKRGDGPIHKNGELEATRVPMGGDALVCPLGQKHAFRDVDCNFACYHWCTSLLPKWVSGGDVAITECPINHPSIRFSPCLVAAGASPGRHISGPDRDLPNLQRADNPSTARNFLRLAFQLVQAHRGRRDIGTVRI